MSDCYQKGGLVEKYCKWDGDNLPKWYPFTPYVLILTHQQQTAFENIVGKGEIARNEQFLLFPQCFLFGHSFITYPCFPGVLLTSTPHNIPSKPLAAFPHNHCRNNRQW